MRTAEKLTLDLYAVPNHFALAVFANRSHRLNCALEAVEGVPRSGSFDDECLVIIIAADLTLGHILLPFSSCAVSVGRRHAVFI
jgi:hypothetical protein